MTGTYIELDYLDLVMAASLLLVDGLISVALRLGLVRSLAIAAGRMVVQLMLMGLILEWLFTHASPLMTFVAFAVMVAFAGREVVARQKRRLKGAWAFGLGASSMLLAAGLVTMMALMVQLRADPWYAPRYAIPLGGMLLGNTMTGVSLGLGALTQGLTIAAPPSRRVWHWGQRAGWRWRRLCVMPCVQGWFRSSIRWRRPVSCFCPA